MVVTLVPGFGSGGGRVADDVLADIGGQKLHASDVRATIQRLLKDKSIPAEMLQYYLPQLIREEVAKRAVVLQSEEMGYSVRRYSLSSMREASSPAAMSTPP